MTEDSVVTVYEWYNEEDPIYTLALVLDGIREATFADDIGTRWFGGMVYGVHVRGVDGEEELWHRGIVIPGTYGVRGFWSASLSMYFLVFKVVVGDVDVIWVFWGIMNE